MRRDREHGRKSRVKSLTGGVAELIKPLTKRFTANQQQTERPETDGDRREKARRRELKMGELMSETSARCND